MRLHAANLGLYRPGLMGLGDDPSATDTTGLPTLPDLSSLTSGISASLSSLTDSLSSGNMTPLLWGAGGLLVLMFLFTGHDKQGRSEAIRSAAKKRRETLEKAARADEDYSEDVKAAKRRHPRRIGRLKRAISSY